MLSSAKEENDIARAVRSLKRMGRAPSVAVVLGSGAGNLLEMEGKVRAYARIPGFPRTGIEGHSGRLSFGRIDDVPVAVLRGRVHLYEGHAPAVVIRPMRILARWGVGTVFLTNAAGGLRRDLVAGTLMVIRDHLDLTGASPLAGSHREKWGPRFPDLSRVYDPLLVAAARRIGGRDIRQGVYAAVRGPAFETPAEAKMLRRLGADAVGMSTVPEAVAAKQAGLRVLGLSCISNRSGGGGREGRHEDVMAQVVAAGARMEKILRGLLPMAAGSR